MSTKKKKTFGLLKSYLRIVCQMTYRSSSILGKLPFTADFLKKLTTIYESTLASLTPSNENYTHDLSEYANSEFIHLPTEISIEFLLVTNCIAY